MYIVCIGKKDGDCGRICTRVSERQEAFSWDESAEGGRRSSDGPGSCLSGTRHHCRRASGTGRKRAGMMRIEKVLGTFGNTSGGEYPALRRELHELECGRYELKSSFVCVAASVFWTLKRRSELEGEMLSRQISAGFSNNGGLMLLLMRLSSKVRSPNISASRLSPLARPPRAWQKCMFSDISPERVWKNVCWRWEGIQQAYGDSWEQKEQVSEPAAGRVVRVDFLDNLEEHVLDLVPELRNGVSGVIREALWVGVQDDDGLERNNLLLLQI